tara:strand:- start:10772 stop:11071 length:300 start_codon:yes stop_codon:yes gene_type:complete
MSEMDFKTDMAREAMLQARRNLLVFDKKQQDYGSKNIASWGTKRQDMFGVLTRIKDKVHRIANLLESEGDPNNESIQDNCMDIANYGLILSLLNEDKWR